MARTNFCSRSRKVPAPKEGEKDGELFRRGKIARRNIARLYEKGRALGHRGRLLKLFVQQNHVILE